jgi:DNA-binding SARP family transcriptional activator
MFLPRVMRPLPTAAWPTNPNVQRIAEAPFSVVRGPQGSYVAEWLAAAIESWARWHGCVWLRTKTTQPSSLASSLTSACLYRWTDTAGGEPRGEAAPSAELAAAMRLSPPGAVVVLELEGRVTAGLARLVAGIRRLACDRGVSLIAVTQRRLPAVVLRGSDCVVPAADLRDQSLVSDGIAGLPDRYHGRLLRLAGRRSAVLHDVLDAARAWPSDAVVDALEASRRSRSVTDRLTANLLDLCSPGQRAALEVCVATGYWHPQLATHEVDASELRPWVVPLECQWGWLRPIWARSLDRHLTGRAGGRPRLHTSAGTRGPGGAHVAAVAAPVGREPRRGIVEARLLGALELRVDGVPITKWTGHRGTSVLRLLLSRRRHACARDELLAEFWPEVAPAAARNRLQVAVSGVRRVLQEVTNLQVVEYADGEYRINPKLVVEVDVERFEAAMSTAGGAERAGDLEGALAAYQEAVGLYRGDFASDAPYEQWALLPRESLRITYIDALDRSSRIQLRLGRLDDCIASGLRMLAVDPCREDAHRLLMRCYASQGRVYQALRQYDFCCRMLQATLETGPASQTTKLYLAIRAGSVPSPP